MEFRRSPGKQPARSKREARIERATTCLVNRSSTTELHSQRDGGVGIRTPPPRHARRDKQRLARANSTLHPSPASISRRRIRRPQPLSLQQLPHGAVMLLGERRLPSLGENIQIEGKRKPYAAHARRLPLIGFIHGSVLYAALTAFAVLGPLVGNRVDASGQRPIPMLRVSYDVWL